MDKDGLPEPMSKTNLAASAKTPGINPHAIGSSDGLLNLPSPELPTTAKFEVKTVIFTNADASVVTRSVTNALVTATAPAAEVAAKKKDPEDPNADLEEDVPEIDIAMNEAKRILCDLIQLTKEKSAGNGLAVTAPK